MQKPLRLKKRFFIFPISIVSLFLLFCGLSKDTELFFSRNVPSDLKPQHLNRNIESVSRWPQWFYSLDEAQIIQKPPTQEIQTGSLIKMKMNPHKGPRKKFELTFEVKEYIPNKKLSLLFLKDSSGRINKILKNLEWTLLIEETSKGSVIHGFAKAQTHHWRSRIIGKIATQILMNQVFYPDLIKLSQLRQPFSIDPSPNLGLTQF